jgi:hypothetical protein
MRIFVDTNILFDLIADRKPFSKFDIHIFSAAEKDKVELLHHPTLFQQPIRS